MNDSPLHLVIGQLTGSAPLDTAISRVILNQVSIGALPETLQVGLPERAVAFGKHDAISQGFEDAVNIAVRHGFEPTIRIAGGRAIVFHPGTVRFAWTIPSRDPVQDMHARFQTVSELAVAALGSLGIEATIGELDREYCAGRYSVHLIGGGKVMGTGQRLAKNAAQIAGMIVVTDAQLINEVLQPIYETLDVPMDPARTGAVSDVDSVHPDAVAEAFIARATIDRSPILRSVADATLIEAQSLSNDHNPLILA